MEMLFGIRRLSFSRLFTVTVAMFLILYLVYDFISYKTKSRRQINHLAHDSLVKIPDHLKDLKESMYNKETERVFDTEGQVKLQPDVKTESLDEKLVPRASVETQEQGKKPSSAYSDRIPVTDGKVKEYTRDEEAVEQLSDRLDTSTESRDDDKGIRDRSKEVVGDTTDQSKHGTNGTVKGKTMRKKLVAYKKAIEYEGHLRDANNTFIVIVNRARYVSGLLHKPKIVLLSFVYESGLPFVHSWLCNTKELELHRQVLLVAKDTETERTITKTWPEINVVSLQSSLSVREYAQISKNNSAQLLCKLQLINSLLQAGVSLLLFDIKSVWFENPLQDFPRPEHTKIDALVNIVPNSYINTGFLVLYATEKTQYFWKALYSKLRKVEIKSREPQNQETIVLFKYYEEYLQKMMVSRYEGIIARKLPIYSYADGMWYLLSDEERAKTKPVVIRNNFVHGNEKIGRAKQWNHWFLQHDGTCDVDLVRKTVKM